MTDHFSHRLPAVIHHADDLNLTHFDYNLPVIQLPSTSPANAMYSLEKLIEKWKVILWKEI